MQGRASNSQEVLMEQEAIYVGIDVAKGDSLNLALVLS